MGFSYDDAKEWFTEYFDEEGNKLASFRSIEYPGLCADKFYMVELFVPDEDESYKCSELWYIDTSNEDAEPELLLSCYNKDDTERALLNIIFDELKMFLELQASRRRKFRGA